MSRKSQALRESRGEKAEEEEEEENIHVSSPKFRKPRHRVDRGEQKQQQQQHLFSLRRSDYSTDEEEEERRQNNVYACVCVSDALRANIFPADVRLRSLAIEFRVCGLSSRVFFFFLFFSFIAVKSGDGSVTQESLAQLPFVAVENNQRRYTECRRREKYMCGGI